MRFGGLGFQASLRQVIDDGLMTVFFFVVGMEIKRELVEGELRSLRQAMLPAIAAAGGVLLPAVIYFALNRGTPAERGWAIPMATDIAFSIGCIVLLGKRVPRALLVFLTALAIFDDIAGILVIAFFYGGGLSVDRPGLGGGAGAGGVRRGPARGGERAGLRRGWGGAVARLPPRRGARDAGRGAARACWCRR